MTVVAYALDAPPAAALRGGDAHARDLSQGRNVGGPHSFALPNHCRISNGIVRATVGAAGGVPSLVLERDNPPVITGDTYSHTYSDTYGGSYTTRSWAAMGTVLIDSPSVAAVLTGASVVEAGCPGDAGASVTLRLVVPLLGDVYVVMERGEPMVRIFHGDERSAVDIDRSISFSSLTGTASTDRVEETTPATPGLYRFVASIDPTTSNGGAFSVTASSVTTARFGAGVGRNVAKDRPVDLHRQLADNSRLRVARSAA